MYLRNVSCVSRCFKHKLVEALREDECSHSYMACAAVPRTRKDLEPPVDHIADQIPGLNTESRARLAPF